MSAAPRSRAQRRRDTQHRLTHDAALTRPAIAALDPAQPPGLISAGTIAPVSHLVRGRGEQDDKPTSRQDLP